MNTILEFKKVGYTYEEESAPSVLQDMSFQIHKGDFVALIGSNGAGKTTTSKLMNGLLKPLSGDVLVEGVSTRKLKTSQIARKVGMLFQDPSKQICQNTVSDEIAFGLYCQGMPKDQVAERVRETLKEFGLDGDASPHTLSRGEKQFLALASVIAGKPEVLILDEPTTGLDYRECVLVMDRVKQLNKSGTTVIMVCHDMEIVLDYALRVLVVAQGKLIAEGAPETVFRNDEVMKEASLLPPQIIDLSLELASEIENGLTFAHISTVSGMVQTLHVAGLGKKRKVS